jgi:hypothetical protein
MEIRVFFRGNDVVYENWGVAMFQELGSAPATVVAAKMRDLCELIRNHTNENADATEAYMQSLLGLWACELYQKWTHQSDRDLRRLICYVNTTKDHAMIGWCGDPDALLELRAYADADFAGCVRTTRSTTGVALAVERPNARVVANGVSKRQTAVSHSTPEAEIVAADYAMRAEGVPDLSLISTILERLVELCMMEDNEAMIKICLSGKNPTMRYLNRTHEVGVSLVNGGV